MEQRGSETGKGERKQTESRVLRNREDRMGNQAERTGKAREAKAERAVPEKPAVRRVRESWERKNRRPSSEMLRRKRTKESGS